MKRVTIILMIVCNFLFFFWLSHRCKWQPSVPWHQSHRRRTQVQWALTSVHFLTLGPGVPICCHIAFRAVDLRSPVTDLVSWFKQKKKNEKQTECLRWSKASLCVLPSPLPVTAATESREMRTEAGRSGGVAGIPFPSSRPLMGHLLQLLH